MNPASVETYCNAGRSPFVRQKNHQVPPAARAKMITAATNKVWALFVVYAGGGGSSFSGEG
jgi:hypothetical protein